MLESKTLLQEMLSEFGCTVINYTDSKIMVDFFYSEEMFEKFKSGLKCKQGTAIYDSDQELKFNRIPDGILVIVRKDGLEKAKYKYTTVSKATITYRETKEDGKKANISLTFRIRENKFDNLLNYVDTKGNYKDFFTIDELQGYLQHQYRDFKFSIGGEFFEG